MKHSELVEYKKRGEKITCLTAYDASFAKLIDSAGTDIILVGDSLGMVIYGAENTLAVTMQQMATRRLRLDKYRYEPRSKSPHDLS